MDIPKLYIAPKKYTGESTVVSMRMPKDMLQVFDDIAAATGRARSEVMTICLEFALQYMEIPTSERKDEKDGDHQM